MQTVGIIGGLGPQTTADFYMRLQVLVDVDTAGSRPPIIINSIPITTHLEQENIIHERNFEPVLPYLLDASKSLEKAGANFIVLPCNSLHIFDTEISESITVPFLSMVSSVLDTIESQDIKKVGLLGTYVTNSSGIYTERLRSKGIEVVQLSEDDQKQLSELILRLINNNYDDNDRVILKNLIESLTNNGAEKIILACTDLRLVLNDDVKDKIIDSVEILAQYTASDASVFSIRVSSIPIVYDPLPFASGGRNSKFFLATWRCGYLNFFIIISNWMAVFATSAELAGFSLIQPTILLPPFRSINSSTAVC